MSKLTILYRYSSPKNKLKTEKYISNIYIYSLVTKKTFHAGSKQCIKCNISHTVTVLLPAGLEKCVVDHEVHCKLHYLHWRFKGSCNRILLHLYSVSLNICCYISIN